MPKTQHLMQRGQTWYIRLRIPTDLLSEYDGKKEIQRSLKTRDFDEARKRITEEKLIIENEFETVRRRLEARAQGSDVLSTLSNGELELLAMKCFLEMKKVSDQRSAGDAHKKPSRHYQQELEEEVTLLEMELKGELPKKADFRGINAASDFLEKKNISFAWQSERFNKFSNLILKGIYEISMQKLRYWKGKPFLPTDAMFQNIDKYQLEENKRRIKLKDLIEEYRSDPSKDWGQGTEKGYTIIFRALLELVGDETYVDTIDRVKCREVRDTLLKMPANATKKSKKASIKESILLAEKNNWPIVTTGTFNEYMHRFSALMEYACREEYIASNPARGLAVKEKTSKKDKRNSFNSEQLKIIFDQSHYRGKEIENEKYRDAGYWIPLISLWTGMRLNEICQLTTDDFSILDGCDIILIRENEELDKDEKRVKTEAGIRFVPVHPELQKFGLLKYIDTQRKRGLSRVFPHMPKDGRGYYSDHFSKWYSRHLTNIGVKTKKISFHSFRHSYRDALRNCEISQEIARALGGWASDATDEIYGSGYKASVLYKHIAKLNYDGLDLSHLYK